jgi:hypothetical protein
LVALVATKQRLGDLVPPHPSLRQSWWAPSKKHQGKRRKPKVQKEAKPTNKLPPLSPKKGRERGERKGEEKEKGKGEI